MTNYIEKIRELDDRLVVELSFKRVNQFFDPDDPSPIGQRDLSPEAEDAVIYAIIDREPHKPVEYIIRFPVSEVTKEVETDLPLAFRTYFRYRCEKAKRNLRILRKRIKYGLITGLSISAFLILIGLYALSWHTQDIWGEITIGAIIIFCWVALWDPIDIFLHQYIMNKGTIRIAVKRVITSKVTVEKAEAGPDGMPIASGD
ncbi:MAG TPA: hypothetical protein VMC42_08155 [Methanoregulaceae archaeon]|nr:hypothetical protein [Methanoregulaceae archaeon]